MEKIYVFVYGTLMRNHRNHGYLENSTYVGEGSIEGYEIYDLGRYPGIIKGSGTVYGEVYQVTEETEKKLDYLEEEGDLYLKKPEVVRLDDGRSLEAMVYVYNKSVSGCKKLEGRY